MFAISAAYAQDINRDKEYLLNPYEIGIEKELKVPDMLAIKYKNVWKSNTEVIISGSVIIPPKYKIIDLTIDYYIFDMNQKATRVVMLELEKGAMPNSFIFNITYPFDLPKYDGELFVIEFDNELHDTQSI